MSTAIRKVNTLILMTVLLVSIAGTVMSLGASNTNVPESAAVPSAAANPIGPLADESTIVDPRGQSVKQNKMLDLGRQVKLDLINPVDWALDVNGKNLLSVQIPLDLDLTLGMTFPLNASIAYDPYAVHNGTNFDYVMSLDNKGCTPYATVGVNMNFDLSKLNFQMGDLPGLNFGVNWAPLTYDKTWNIPFYGTTTKMGNWISYNIVDKYVSLDQMLNLVGLPAISEYGIKGGVGVRVQYNLYSYVTATADVSSRFGSSQTNFRWDELGDKVLDVNVNSAAQHGEYMSIVVGNWTYHIKHDVTFTVWADVGLSVVGINLFDQTFEYAYTLGLGELKFPEKTAYSFVSKPQVLAGRNAMDVPASWTALGIDWSPTTGGQFSAFDYNVEIPENDELSKWFTDMNVDAGISASLGVDFPFNMKSYYNARNAIKGSQLDYNVIVDSYDTTSPNINYNLGGFLDLSSVSIFGKQLERYSFNKHGDLYTAKGFKTPFGVDTFEEEITSLVKLDTASDMLNDYLSNMMYGINPDIQFRAWIALKIEGAMTGTMVLQNNNAGASITGATEFKWDEQYDTQTTRVNIPNTALAGQSFQINYTDLEYTIKVTPGIKLGVSVLGGIIGFDYTFFIPGVSGYLTKDFAAEDFVETVYVQDMSFKTYGLSVPSSVPVGTNTVSGSFLIENTGSQTDGYNVVLDTSNLPAGTTAFSTTTGGNNILGGGNYQVDYSITLGEKAHAEEYLMNELMFDVKSNTRPELFSKIGATLNLIPDPALVSTSIIAESSVDVTPGVGIEVPITITNDGRIPAQYTLSLTGGDSYIGALSQTGFYLSAGESKGIDFDIAIARLSTNVPASKELTLTVSAANKVWTQKIVYNIMPFDDDKIYVNPSIAPKSVVLGSDALYQFFLENQGNVAETYNVSVITDASYTVGGSLNYKQYTVAPGSKDTAEIKLFTSTMGPGEKEFTVVVAKGMDVIFTQYYSLTVRQVTVSVMADSYEVNTTTKSVEYTITVYNNGASDNFAVSIEGLDSSLYTLDTTGYFFLPKESAKVIHMTITSPEDLTKAAGDVNGFRVAVTSQTYGFKDDSKFSAVKIPVMHKSEFPAGNVINDLAGYVDLTFTLKNSGNVRETYTINVEGADGLLSVVYVNAVGVTADSNNTIVLSKGESVQVTVRISKTKDGLFYPKVNVVDGSGAVVKSISTTMAIGFVFVNLWWIILVGAVLVIGVILSFAVINRRNEARLMTASERAEAKPSIFKKMSDSMSGVKARLDEKRHDREMLNAGKSDVPASTAAEDDGWTKSPSKLDVVKEKLEVKRKEKQAEKQKDNAFWED